MSVRYVAMKPVPRAWVSASHVPETLPTIQVFEAVDDPVDTGLVTADGTPLYRVTDKDPIGFKRRNV